MANSRPALIRRRRSQRPPDEDPEDLLDEEWLPGEDIADTLDDILSDLRQG